MSNGIVDGNVKGIFLLQATIDPANIATATTSEQTFTLTGAKVGDAVLAVKPSVTAGVAVAGARISAADTVAVTFVTTTTNVDAASETWNFIIFRPESQTAKVGISA